MTSFAKVTNRLAQPKQTFSLWMPNRLTANNEQVSPCDACCICMQLQSIVDIGIDSLQRVQVNQAALSGSLFLALFASSMKRRPTRLQ